jgi:hypothetical protein
VHCHEFAAFGATIVGKKITAYTRFQIEVLPVHEETLAPVAA